MGRALGWSRIATEDVLIGRTDTLTQSRYVQCVTEAARRVIADGFLPERFLQYYVDRANASPIDRPDLP